jgi:hypothetical protein
MAPYLREQSGRVVLTGLLLLALWFLARCGPATI